MARFAITGAAGFVPAAVVRALRATGDEVLCWVRPGADTWRIGAAPLLALDVRSCLEPDGRRKAVERLRDFGADTVIHAAWTGIRGEARQDLRQVENVTLAVELVKVAADAGVKRVVGVGSQAEYGPLCGPVAETAPCAPTSLYGASKLAAGHLVLALSRRLGLSTAWARLFSVYGPGERTGALIPELARALAERRRLPLGDGLQRWDYLFEDDAGSAIATLARTLTAEGVFNVASGRSVLLRDVMRRVAELVGNGEPPQFGERPPGDGEVVHLEADISRLSAATGWKASMALEAGLQLTVNAVLGRSVEHGEPGVERARA